MPSLRSTLSERVVRASLRWCDQISAIGFLGLPAKPATADEVPLIVLLVSKRHARLLHDDHEFCSRLIYRAINRAEGQVDLLAGVVDGVTFPKNKQIRGLGVLSALPKSSGFEGISVWVSESKVAAPELWSTAERPEDRSSANPAQPSGLSFQFQSTDPKLQTTRVLQLPLSNTLFLNGQVSTLYAQRWTVTGILPPCPRLLSDHRTRLSHQVLRMTDFWQVDSEGTSFNIETRLDPMSSPRRVAASFGNVISKLQSDDVADAQRSFPASTDLENWVSQRMRMGKLADQQVEFWALVTPREKWVDSSYLASPDLQMSLNTGSRLHKVLGGGGGWGLKKGLLALDPGFDYQFPDSPLSVGEMRDPGQQQIEQRGVGEVVRPGDVVAFYVCNHLDPPDSYSANSLNKKSWCITSSASIALGTVPSTSDIMPDASGGRDTIMGIDYLYVRNHFGMVSEQGMALKIAVQDARHGSLLGQNELDMMLKTKLDPPYTQFLGGHDTSFTIEESKAT